MGAKILWVEGNRHKTPSFRQGLRSKGYEVKTVPTGKAALKRPPDFEPNLVVVNAASFRSSGRRICGSLREQSGSRPIVLIQNGHQPSPREADADEQLVLPFTLRKLLNRIRLLLPTGRGKVLKAGPIWLYPESGIVSRKGEDVQHLTPRLTALLQMLIEHAGEVVSRDELFSKVWETEYIEDTRTLDVHVSWLRQAIEPDPSNPKHLKTLRGLGYRLDI